MTPELHLIKNGKRRSLYINGNHGHLHTLTEREIKGLIEILNGVDKNGNEVPDASYPVMKNYGL